MEQTEKLVAETVFESLTNQFPKTTPDLLYTYSFCLTGLVGMLKSWLSAESPESPQYMADLTHKLFTNITRDFYTE